LNLKSLYGALPLLAKSVNPYQGPQQVESPKSRQGGPAQRKASRNSQLRLPPPQSNPEVYPGPEAQKKAS